MKNMNKYAKWRLGILKSIQLQLFMTLISLPFLIAWGLPISLLSPIATILFTPFLTLFLLTSSIIFFLELLHLPNNLPIWLLEQITLLWTWFLQKNQQSWLIGFALPPLLFLPLIIVATLGIVHSKKIVTLENRIACLLVLLLIVGIILKFFPYNYQDVGTITCNNKEITFINSNGTLTMVEPGALSTRPSYESWISYTLIPELIKRTGSLTIDHLVLLKINKRIFDAITFLSTKITIKNLYCAWWTGRIPLFAWKSYSKLKRTLLHSGGKIHAISKYRTLFKAKKSTLSIEPHHTKNINYYSAVYPLLCVSGCINQQKIAL